MGAYLIGRPPKGVASKYNLCYLSNAASTFHAAEWWNAAPIATFIDIFHAC
jgi:hypothetical protein